MTETRRSGIAGNEHVQLGMARLGGELVPACCATLEHHRLAPAVELAVVGVLNTTGASVPQETIGGPVAPATCLSLGAYGIALCRTNRQEGRGAASLRP